MSVVIITGASSGIGKGIALFFAEQKWRLSLSGRNVKALAEVAALCVKNGSGDVVTTAGDITSQTTREAILENTMDKFGKIDTLVNNAGMAIRGELASTSVDSFDKIFDVNVRSVIQLTQLALPQIIAAKGTIVNISSVAGLVASPNSGYYCMSKAALDQFTKVLALEVADKGVRVNSVKTYSPGLITSEFQIRAGMPQEYYTEFVEAYKPIVPLKRIGQPIEIAKAVYFLATDASSFTTGELLKVDGGAEITRPRINLQPAMK